MLQQLQAGGGEQEEQEEEEVEKEGLHLFRLIKSLCVSSLYSPVQVSVRRRVHNDAFPCKSRARRKYLP